MLRRDASLCQRKLWLQVLANNLLPPKNSLVVGFQLPEDGDWAVTQSLPSFQWLSRVRLHQAASGVLQARYLGIAAAGDSYPPAPANLERAREPGYVCCHPTASIPDPYTNNHTKLRRLPRRHETTPHRPARPERRVLFVSLLPRTCTTGWNDLFWLQQTQSRLAEQVPGYPAQS